ncbi:MAG: hypothetical protein V4493_07510 [Pseudomonadota bacterium]
MALQRTFKWLMVMLLPAALGGCLGGTVAQQLVRTMMMQGADKATAAVIDIQEKNEQLAAQKMPLKDTPPDPYKLAFVNAAFETVPVKIEPLPATPLDEEAALQTLQETKLVQVEVWSLLVGDEKQNILEKASIQGAIILPPKAEWQQWQIAIGAAENNATNGRQTGNRKMNSKQPITFLIPPEMGKMHSGEKAVVELSNAGDLSVARYAVN